MGPYVTYLRRVHRITGCVGYPVCYAVVPATDVRMTSTGLHVATVVGGVELPTRYELRCQGHTNWHSQEDHHEVVVYSCACSTLSME
jgi:hypothetical protein